MRNVLAERKLYLELEDFISKTQKNEAALIEILHKTQQLFGYIPQDAVLMISQETNIHASKIYGVVTFYSYFTEVPKGEYQISVCLGTACYVKGAEEVLREFERVLGIKAGETTPDRKFSIAQTRCLGDCSQAPVVMINEELYGNVEISDVPGIISKY